MPGVSDFVFWGGYFKTLKTQKYYFYSMPLFEHGFSINLASSLVSIVLGLHRKALAKAGAFFLFSLQGERSVFAFGVGGFELSTNQSGQHGTWAAARPVFESLLLRQKSTCESRCFFPVFGGFL